MRRGKIISLEGLDSSGKSTQIQKISKYLEDLSISYKFFHFPMYGHNPFSDVISKFLRGEFGNISEVDPYFVANIYAMDRFMFLPSLEKALAEVDIVLLDRYVFSNIAYQGAKLEGDESLKIKSWINKFEFDLLKIPYPDLSIFLDIPIGTIEKRIKMGRGHRDYLNGQEDIHEKDLDFQRRVRENYISLIGYPNYAVIRGYTNTDGNSIDMDPDTLFQQYESIIGQCILGDEFND